MSVSGELSVGLIRCIDRYDNISFIIKTPFSRMTDQNIHTKSLRQKF